MSATRFTALLSPDIPKICSEGGKQKSLANYYAKVACEQIPAKPFKFKM